MKGEKIKKGENSSLIKILLIEDNPGDVRLIQEILSEARNTLFNLKWANCLQAGLKLLVKGEIDVVLLDLSLPDSHGFDTFLKLHAQVPEVPIVVLTDLNDEAVAVKAMREGTQDYLIKGEINSNLLVRSLRYAIERKKTEETIRYLAYHDALTGLPNRTLFNDRLTLSLSQAQRHRKKLAVMMLDIDYFKNINDTLGHKVGDKLLQIIGDRLIRELLRKEDTVARMGGDEFMLLLPEMAHAEDAAKVAQRVLRAIEKPLVINNHKLQITTSIGIAIYPKNGKDADTLMKNADIAMYCAKKKGHNNYQYYTSDVDANYSGG